MAEICRELDGLPLAVELAASRLKVLSPDAILARLGERLALLTGGAADAPARQRTLRATIAWSYDLLPRGERLLFTRCAVFVGGFDLDGVQRCSRSDEELLLDAVGLLVDHNLVIASVGSDGEPRFSMLETIREFGLAELSEADVAQTRDRHADFCIRLAESAGSRLQGADHARWLARLNQDLDNIRAARAWLSDRGDSERLCRLAAPMGTYWRYYGSISEGRTWLMEALGGSAKAAPSSRAAVLMTAGWLEAVGGDVAGGRDLLEQALELFEQLGDLRSIADTLYHLGSTLIDLGDDDLATAHVERGLEIAREQGYADRQGRLTYASSVSLRDVDRNRLPDRRRLFLRRSTPPSAPATCSGSH